MPEKVYVSYTDIHNEVVDYANIIKDNNVNYDMIIALARGGSLIGTILSHALDTPVKIVEYSSIFGQGETKHAYNANLPKLKPHQHLLVVDDICDSGHTLQEVMEHYEADGHVVNTYAVYFREHEHFVHTPNHSYVIEDDAWIVFPFEHSEKIGTSYVL